MGSCMSSPPKESDGVDKYLSKYSSSSCGSSSSSPPTSSQAHTFRHYPNDAETTQLNFIAAMQHLIDCNNKQVDATNAILKHHRVIRRHSTYLRRASRQDHQRLFREKLADLKDVLELLKEHQVCAIKAEEMARMKLILIKGMM